MNDLTSIIFKFIEQKQRKHIIKQLAKEIKEKEENTPYPDKSIMSELSEFVKKENISGDPETLIENYIYDIALDSLKRNPSINFPHAHIFKRLTDKQLKDDFMSEGADCLICHKDFGWRCKESPDGVCHYFTQPKGISVNLINGNIDTVKFKKSGNYNSDYESWDWCVYCGMPEERK